MMIKEMTRCNGITLRLVYADIGGLRVVGLSVVATLRLVAI